MLLLNHCQLFSQLSRPLFIPRKGLLHLLKLCSRLSQPRLVLWPILFHLLQRCLSVPQPGFVLRTILFHLRDGFLHFSHPLLREQLFHFGDLLLRFAHLRFIARMLTFYLSQRLLYLPDPLSIFAGLLRLFLVEFGRGFLQLTLQALHGFTLCSLQGGIVSHTFLQLLLSAPQIFTRPLQLFIDFPVVFLLRAYTGYYGIDIETERE